MIEASVVDRVASMIGERRVAATTASGDGLGPAATGGRSAPIGVVLRSMPDAGACT